MEFRATSAGTYWFKVVTQSAYGRSLTSGHPTASFLLRPPAPTNLILLKMTNGDRLVTWLPAIPGSYEPETYIIRVRDSGTNALKRTATVQISDSSLAAKWTFADGDGSTSSVTTASDGTISAGPNVGGTTGVNYTSQLFYGDGDYEFEVDDRQFFGFKVVNGGTTNSVAILQNSYARGEGSSFLQFISADATSFGHRRLNAKTKLTIRLRNNTAEYRMDDAFWAFAGLLLQPPASTTFLRAEFFSVSSDPLINEAQAYVRCRFLPSNPHQYVYGDGMAKQDFGGSNPATVKIEITQISASGIESAIATITG